MEKEMQPVFFSENDEKRIRKLSLELTAEGYPNEKDSWIGHPLINVEEGKYYPTLAKGVRICEMKGWWNIQWVGPDNLPRSLKEYTQSNDNPVPTETPLPN